MNPIDPRKNETVLALAATFFAVSAGIMLLRFVGGSAPRCTVTSGVACTLAMAVYLVGILWGIHEDGKRR